jgi:hypothetical protein
MRYLKNNYFDGSRQDALDLLTGSFSVRKGTSTPLVDSRPFVTKSVRFCFLWPSSPLCSAYGSLAHPNHASTLSLQMPMILALAVSLNICSLLASSYWGKCRLVSSTLCEAL